MTIASCLEVLSCRRCYDIQPKLFFSRVRECANTPGLRRDAAQHGPFEHWKQRERQTRARVDDLATQRRGCNAVTSPQFQKNGSSSTVERHQLSCFKRELDDENRFDIQCFPMFVRGVDGGHSFQKPLASGWGPWIIFLFLDGGEFDDKAQTANRVWLGRQGGSDKRGRLLHQNPGLARGVMAPSSGTHGECCCRHHRWTLKRRWRRACFGRTNMQVFSGQRAPTRCRRN